MPRPSNMQNHHSTDAVQVSAVEQNCARIVGAAGWYALILSESAAAQKGSVESLPMTASVVLNISSIGKKEDTHGSMFTFSYLGSVPNRNTSIIFSRFSRLYRSSM